MFDFLFQHPNIIGTVIAAIAAVELSFLSFRFEEYKTFFRRRPWLHLLFQESESRIVLVSSAIMFLVVGICIVGAEQGWLTRPFCGAICTVALLNFLATMIQDKRRGQPKKDEELG
jgi:hypothetical protein